ncbi:hypoxanthine-xanthine-guanine phosphoribosyl transferase, putative [Eimeria acervulina]|uniref:Hypoxanthine phosphoribosyltransferase n=1 Tax=Eimeria acervulina TaxID=5801 RepID=U6GV46_EIMAC|nr:hypoxanthine-xanthine-guanine phosphoribosyl transferase, putative [Eimeria acervulina]CDI84030.1 hypoxanthine-xanthine-guanine phosphoribosyl transferase, putative [Eimeria acervulina]
MTNGQPLGSAPIVIGDDVRYSPDDLLLPKQYHKYIENIIIPNGLLMDRVEKMAYDIRKAYRNRELHCLCLLKGSRSFFSALFQHLAKLSLYDEEATCPPFFEHYLRVSSCVGTESTNQLKVVSDDLSCLKGKDVLIVEDIIDTGLTLTELQKYLQQFQPNSVRIATLTLKRTTRSNGQTADFVGFSLPDKWVIGFSFDCNQMFRDMPHVCTLSDNGKRLLGLKV